MKIMYTTDAVESEGEFRSYQPPKQSSTKQQRNKGERKRKAETENLYAVQTKIKRTEDSIKKLEKHIEDKTCPKSLRYSARANIPPDEEFKKDIQAVKQKAERGFLSALTRFNYRRLEKQKIKLRKLKGKSLLTDTAKGSRNASRPKEPTQNKNIVNLAAILGIELEKVPTMLSTLKEIVNNKERESYTCLLTECSNTTNYNTGKKNQKGKSRITKKQIKTKKRIERRKRSASLRTKHNERFIKNLSKTNLTETQTRLLSKGLKFIPTATVTKNKIRRQLLRDFNDFARRMRLKYIFQGQNKQIHPFYVKSNWEPPMQWSVTLETYLEEVPRGGQTTNRGVENNQA